jgi:dUTP pyrophosphatase
MLHREIQVSDAITLQVKLIHPLAKIPSRARDTDAGYDLTAIERVICKAHASTMVQTGIQLACPPGWYYTIEGRSSLWSKGIDASRGIIDSTYCGDLYVSLTNYNDTDYVVEPSDRIAQILLHQVWNMSFNIVSEFDEIYNKRGTAGFGSTGR